MAYDADRDWWWEQYFGETPIDRALDKGQASYASWAEANPGGLIPYVPDIGDLSPVSPYTLASDAGSYVGDAAARAAKAAAKAAADAAAEAFDKAVKYAVIGTVLITVIGAVYMAQKE
jgi:hypothetical protein